MRGAVQHNKLRIECIRSLIAVNRTLNDAPSDAREAKSTGSADDRQSTCCRGCTAYYRSIDRFRIDLLPIQGFFPDQLFPELDAAARKVSSGRSAENMPGTTIRVATVELAGDVNLP